jgi:CubicO group peptidase (beta-lactamase class C family)
MALRHALLVAVSLALAACGASTAVTAADPCAAPVPDADWPTSTPPQAGLDASGVCALLTSVANGRHNIHALLIERHGRLVAELYRSGPDHPITRLWGLANPLDVPTRFDASTLHDVRSVSKSVVSLLYGIELGRRRVPALDAPVAAEFPDPGAGADGVRERITFRHLLTMSSGLQWREWGAGVLQSDETRLFWKSDRVRFVLDRPFIHDPGTTFNYSGGGTTLLADALVRSNGKTLLQLARDDLFGPLGVTAVEWGTDLRGRELPFAGLRLRPRDMLKMGRLVNDRGRWNGHQVVPEAWIAESTAPQIQAGVPLLFAGHAPASYGYQWWTGNVKWRDRQLDWAAAIGNGGQRIFVVPALDLTVVLTAGDYHQMPIQLVENETVREVVRLVTE